MTRLPLQSVSPLRTASGQTGTDAIAYISGVVENEVREALRKRRLAVEAVANEIQREYDVRTAAGTLDGRDVLVRQSIASDAFPDATCDITAEEAIDHTWWMAEREEAYPGTLAVLATIHRAMVAADPTIPVLPEAI